jgi:hypothetical protein
MGLFNLFRGKSIRVRAEQFDQNEKQYIYYLALTKAVYEISTSVKESSGNDLEIIKPEFDRINKFLDSTFSDNEIEKLKNEIGDRFKDNSWQELLGDFLSNLNDNQKEKFTRSLIIFANSDGILELDEMNVIGEWTRGCFPNKSDEELHNYLLEIVKGLSDSEDKLNFDYNEFNELQRKSIIGLLICFAAVDELDDEGKESDLLNEIYDFFQINQSEIDTLPEFDEVIINLKGLTIKQKNILKYLVDLIISSDGEISKEEIALTNYFNEEIILENDSDIEKNDPKITDIKSYEKWLKTEITNEELTGNIYDILKLLKKSEFFKKEVTNMEIIYNELKRGELSNEDQVTKRMIEIYSKEINETPMSIETSVKLKTSSDSYLQIENILGNLLNTMEAGGATNSIEYSDTQQYHTITTFFHKLLNEKSIGAMFSAITGGEKIKEDERDVKEENSDNFKESGPSVCLDCFTLNEDDSKYCSDCGIKL